MSSEREALGERPTSQASMLEAPCVSEGEEVTGSPIDLIVFDGLDEGELRKIVFVEVKSGKSVLSKRERLIKDAIEKKKVEWKILRRET